MARAPPAPHEHLLVRTPSGALCSSCQRSLSDEELCLSEAFVRDDGAWARSHAYARSARPRDYESDRDSEHPNDRMNPDLDARHHHLLCAAKHRPYMLRSALASTAFEVPARAELEARMEQALSVVDAAEADPQTRDEYHRFIQELAAHSDDHLEQVFADWLQSVGDPRGELIALHRAMKSADYAEGIRLAPLEKKLISTHRSRFMPERLEGELTWRAGFVHRVVLTEATTLERVSLSRIFAHPSFRLLHELCVQLVGWNSVVIVANLPFPLPSTLRALELGGTNTSQERGLGDVAALLGAMPRVERLSLGSGCELGLRSTSLLELELRCADAQLEADSGMPQSSLRTFAQRLTGLDFAALPSLQTFTLRVERGLDASLLAVLPSLQSASLARLVLRGDLTEAGITHLRTIKGLRMLDVRGCGVRSHLEADALRSIAQSVLTDEPVAVVAPAPARVAEWKVRHTRRPEWGVGTVVGEGDGGLEVEFAVAGRKQVRNVELLEDLTE